MLGDRDPPSAKNINTHEHKPYREYKYLIYVVRCFGVEHTDAYRGYNRTLTVIGYK